MFTVPCLHILESLNLKQNKYDGFYFNDEKELVAFDGAKMGVCDGTVVRLDYMKKYLEDNQLVLFWTCMGEKQCFNGTNSWEQKWSEWSSFAYLDENDEIEVHLGEILSVFFLYIKHVKQRKEQLIILAKTEHMFYN